MAKVRTAEELGEALKNNESTIEIEGDLARKTIRIRATGKVAWAIAIGAIGIAAAAVVMAPPSGGVSATFGIMAAPAAVSVLGVSVTVAAISVAIAGGISALNKLRNYQEVKRTDELLVLSRV